MRTIKILQLKLALVTLLCLFVVSSCNNSKKGEKNTTDENAANMEMQQGMPPGPPPNGEKPQGMPSGPPPGGEKPNGMPPGPPPNGEKPEGMPQETPPNGGKPGQMPPGGMSQPFDESLIKATFQYNDGTIRKSEDIIKGTGENQSAVATFQKAKVELKNNKITTSGNTTSNDQSSFQGLNAAVLARGESTINMGRNKITTTGTGANAIFAYGQSIIYSDNDVIDCTAGGAHGIMASGGGTIIAANVNMITRGKNSGAVATDRGSGTITVNGGIIKATGQDSPGIYSTGKITVSDAKVTATGAEVAVIEGSNSIVLNNTDLLCSFQDKWGVMIYQSFSGDAEGVDGHFEINGGSLKCDDKTGPLFFVTNSNANIFLNNTDIKEASGILLNAAATDRWGQKGSNGGKANITASQQSLQGELTADKDSRIQLILKDKSELTGSVNTSDEAQYVSVEIDGSSTWTLTKDSYVNNIKAAISGDTVTNITGNGHNIIYSKSECPTLKGKSYKLKNGGSLRSK